MGLFCTHSEPELCNSHSRCGGPHLFLGLTTTSKTINLVAPKALGRLKNDGTTFDENSTTQTKLLSGSPAAAAAAAAAAQPRGLLNITPKPYVTPKPMSLQNLIEVSSCLNCFIDLRMALACDSARPAAGDAYQRPTGAQHHTMASLRSWQATKVLKMALWFTTALPAEQKKSWIVFSLSLQPFR